jgi:hypothetical protein
MSSARLQRTDLYSLERYASERPEFRARAMAHKRARTLHLGPNMTLLFEDRLTVQYQVQEMLRIERIFEADAIDDELAAYNPLIPDGDNFKATCLIEFPDPAERARELDRLRQIERHLYVEVGERRIAAHADEDLDRSNDSKTSAVHFLRFQLDAPAVAALRGGASLAFGVGDARYPHRAATEPALRATLLADLV